jgi:hypothetical protein
LEGAEILLVRSKISEGGRTEFEKLLTLLLEIEKDRMQGNFAHEYIQKK